MDLLQRLRSLPPEAMLPVGWFVEQLESENLPAERKEAGEGLLTVEDVAVRLGRRPSTVRGWFASGHLEGFKLFGRDWRTTEDSLRAFTDAQKGRQPVAKLGLARGRAVDLAAWRGVRRPSDTSAR